MNRKMFKVLILYLLVLCVSIISVGCVSVTKAIPPEGIQQDVYDNTLKFLEEVSEHLKEGNYTEVDRALMRYEEAHPITTGRAGERPVGDSKELVLITRNFINKCVSYLERDSEDILKVKEEKEIYMHMQWLVNELEKGYMIDVQDDKIIIEEIK